MYFQVGKIGKILIYIEALFTDRKYNRIHIPRQYLQIEKIIVYTKAQMKNIILYAIVYTGRIYRPELL
jgi:hypothetical protein